MRCFSSLLCLAALVLTLALPAGAEEADVLAAYEPVLASAANLLSCENPDNHLSGPGETGLQEQRIGVSPEEALGNVGYALKDLNGDGSPELLLAQIDRQEQGSCYGSTLLSVHTLIQGRPSLCLEGWARNRYYLLPDGSLLNQGSGGAAYSCLGLYKLSEEENTLQCLDFFFTWEEEGQVVTYHNSDGAWEVPHEGNEKLELDLWQMSEILEKDVQALELTPFSEYQQQTHPSLLQPVWYPYDTAEGLRQVTLSDSEYSTLIALCPYHGSITKLELLGLELEELDEEGHARFRETVLETIDALSPGEPVVVRLEFGCTLPNFGFRYTDNTGSAHAFSLQQSGMDGSLLTTALS